MIDGIEIGWIQKPKVRVANVYDVLVDRNEAGTVFEISQAGTTIRLTEPMMYKLGRIIFGNVDQAREEATEYSDYKLGDSPLDL